MDFTEEAYYQERLTNLAFTKEVFEAKSFEECEFFSCSFVDCRFEKSKFLNCKFTGCVLSAVVPMNCTFTEVVFFRSKVIGIDWTKAKDLRGLEFAECQVNYSNFKLLKLPKIKIINSEAKEVDFIETDLSRGDFKNTDFERSRFFRTNLSYADFKGAKNYSIDIRNNNLKKTRFALPEALALLGSLDIILE